VHGARYVSIVRAIFTIVLTTLCSVASLNAGKKFDGPRPIDIEWFYEALKNADTLDVLEGLPHQWWESTLQQEEIRTNETLKIDGEFFYQKLLDVSSEKKALYTEKFLQKKLFLRPTDLPIIKPCGGFHADYGLRWSKDGKFLAAALICFGCGEIHLVGDNVSVATDFSPEGHDYLSDALKPLRQSRPRVKIDNNLNQKPEIPKSEPLPKLKLKL